MDAVILNRVGIAVELAGTLLAAPEIVERLVGINTLEGFVERALGRLRSFVESFLKVGGANVQDSVIGVILADYLIVYAVILVLSGNPITHAELGWWWPWRLLTALPAALMAAVLLRTVLSTWFGTIREPLQASGIQRGLPIALGSALLYAVVVPLLLIYIGVICVATPAILPLSTLVRRLRQGWLRLALLGLGVPLFISGLGLQFVATF